MTLNTFWEQQARERKADKLCHYFYAACVEGRHSRFCDVVKIFEGRGQTEVPPGRPRLALARKGDDEKMCYDCARYVNKFNVLIVAHDCGCDLYPITEEPPP